MIVKFIFVLALTCYVLPLCTAQARHVNNFHFATWNSEGFKWDSVLELMNLGRLDVLTVQEAGDLPNKMKLGSIQDAGTPQTYLGPPPGQNDPALSVEDFIWNVNGQTFYIYYFDRRSRQDLVTGQQAPGSKANLAIITRHRGSRVFLMQAIDRRGQLLAASHSRYTINRPVIGVQIENAVFFNLHARPNDVGNEASAVVQALQSQMSSNGLGALTWAVTGDFNRVPNTVSLGAMPTNTFCVSLRSGKPTRQGKELDYGFWGGPTSKTATLGPIELLTDYIARTGSRITIKSDHLPVKFN